MSNIARMMQRATAGAGGAGLDVDEVFSTFLYDGTGSAQTITNGIDLTEGGLVWTKSRSDGYGHRLVDTVNGVGKYLRSESTAALKTDSYAQEGVTAFNSNGYSLGNWANEDGFHRSGSEYVSFTFRKAKKFFDVVQFTNSTGGDEDVSHNLGAVPAMIIGKRTDTADNWMVWHIGTGMSNGGFTGLGLNNTGSAVFTGVQSDQGINSNTFNTGYVLSNDGSGGYSKANQLNGEYIFYLFAHNNSGDGGFGPDADQDVIKCGSYSSATEINLGFEPQWLIAKRTSSTGNWYMVNNMTGFTNAAYGPRLIADLSNAEGSDSIASVTSTGFNSQLFDGSGTYIYMAIRRGPLAAPTDATKVFFVDSGTAANNVLSTGFNPDMSIVGRTTGGSKYVGARLTGSSKYLFTDSTAAEASYPGWTWDESNQFKQGMYNANNVSWTWKRAPSYFDVVAYTGTGSARTVSHNLGAVPEMMWVKARSASGEMWFVYHKDLNVNGDNAPETDYLWLNGTHAAADDSDAWNDTAPTASVFSVKSGGGTNNSGTDYIAYLFATVAGVSKVGSYTGTGNSDITVDCGFSSGARFVLIKKASGSGSWYVADTARGIVSGTDNLLKLNTNSAATTGNNLVDPSSSGFIVSGGAEADSDWNDGGATFIFYAIA